MRDIQKMLERQARWQKGRAALSWPEKIRMAEAIRESIRLLREGGNPADREVVRRPRAPSSLLP